jgi:choloylglycine hydrolase
MLAVATRTAEACTTIAFRDPQQPVVAYNYDFPIGQGMVIVNKRGMAKVSEHGAAGARWQSRFGSITFVQFGRDGPMAGMNEAGLFVSQMWLDEAVYDGADARPIIGVLEYMQYLLDTAGSVEEALALGEKVRIQSRVPLHYELADASGAAAVVEFLDGSRKLRSGGDLPYSVLANSPYQAGIDYLSSADILAPPDGSGSLQRFSRAAASLSTRGDTPAVEHAFATLASVAQPGFTRWSVVFDLRDRAISWRTDRNEAVRSTRLGSFDLSCRAAVKTLDIHAGEGDVTTAFQDFSRAGHEALVKSSYAGTSFLAPQGEAAAIASAHHPEKTSSCQE